MSASRTKRRVIQRSSHAHTHTHKHTTKTLNPKDDLRAARKRQRLSCASSSDLAQKESSSGCLVDSLVKVWGLEFEV